MMPVKMDTKIAIIGADIAGLSAAYYLKQKGYQHITIFEKDNRVGGKCCTLQYQGEYFDLGANLISPSNN